MEFIDFQDSHTVIRVGEDSWRQKITSKLEIYSKREDMMIVDRAFLNYPCLAENSYPTGNEKILFDKGYTWQAIITNELIIVIRLCPFGLVKPETYHLKQEGTLYDEVIIKEKQSNYREIAPKELADDDNSVYILVEYEIGDFLYRLYFEGLYINYRLADFRYQPDVGPILYSESPSIKDENDVNLAFCAFSSLRRNTEFNVLTEETWLPRQVQSPWIMKLMPQRIRNRMTFHYWNKKKEVMCNHKLFVKQD